MFNKDTLQVNTVITSYCKQPNPNNVIIMYTYSTGLFSVLMLHYQRGSTDAVWALLHCVFVEY